jgi:hypothetical protein
MCEWVRWLGDVLAVSWRQRRQSCMIQAVVNFDKYVVSEKLNQTLSLDAQFSPGLLTAEVNKKD